MMHVVIVLELNWWVLVQIADWHYFPYNI